MKIVVKKTSVEALIDDKIRNVSGLRIFKNNTNIGEVSNLYVIFATCFSWY
jgi:hypothetical protein